MSDAPPTSRADGVPTTWDAAASAHARWANGERQALDELVRVLTPVLWHTVRSYGLSAEAAQDVLQNAWLCLVRDPGQVRDSQAVTGWMMTTARRLAWRSTRTREIPVDELAPTAPVQLPTPEDAAIAGFEARRLWQAVSSLNARCQRLLRIIAFADRPDYAAFSAATGTPIGSIGPTRRRCLDKLRSLLEGASA
ncbi:sigma-70 family RNA polymerase sigma factor [Propioniciclava soli]|uniref:Sigma-70 family RNA polymerase sigma factor n=1 Tax=Propioniciclava soli TaxID=2775081 RepID=A0ABZ3C900_9ACTN